MSKSALVIASVVGLAALVPASSASAACHSRIFSVFPGSTPSGVRYGEVRFEFHGCYDSATNSWTGSVRSQNVNNLGSAVGFRITQVTIAPTYTTGSIRTFRGTIYAKWCPGIFVCDSGQTVLTANFTMSKNYQHRVIDFHRGTMTTNTLGTVLFTTP
jgi:hypothetical protein